MFATKGFMLALYMPASFAKYKNKLTRPLYRVVKKTDVKKRWNFIDEIRNSGYGQQAVEDPLTILQIRLPKGELTPQEYEKLGQMLVKY